MAERFIALATLLRAGRVVAPAQGIAPALGPESTFAENPPADAMHADVAGRPSAPQAQVVRNVRDFAHADIVHELALMRLAAREAFERTTVALLDALAKDVLARELSIAAADVASLVERALAAFGNCEPVGLAISGADRGRVHAALPVRIDDALEAGDLIVDVSDGAIASTFAFRLEDALARVALAVRV